MGIRRASSLLLVVDLQEALLPVLKGGAQAVAEATWMGRVAEALEVPVWITEQYPEGLGGTAPSLLAALEAPTCWRKTHFDAHAEPEFARALARQERHQVVLCGAEAHVCVLQTGLALLEAGYEVFLLSEAISSRRPEEAALARQRMERSGAQSVTADMVVYEWLERCDTVQFKDIHRRFLKERSLRPLIFH